MNDTQETVKETPLTISDDLTETKVILNEMIQKWQSGKKTRERALVITKLQEAKFWLVEAQCQE